MNTALTLDALITALILREGGYVNHTHDRGGPTNMGITLRTLSRWRGYPCTAEDVENLQEEEARAIYEGEYWIQPRFNTLELSPVIIDMVFDSGVHHGAPKAIKLLQTAIGVRADGHIGPVTRDAALLIDGPTLAARFMGERVEYIGKIITNDPSQADFAHGWAARMSEFIKLIPKT
jgi:lysozyme family protein